MNNYCIYYIPKGDDKVSDVLMIYFGGSKSITNRSDQNGIGILLSNNDIVGFVMNNFSEICKVKTAGMLFKPNDAFIDLLNSMLSNANLPNLDYIEKTGFICSEIKEIISKDKTFIYKMITPEEIYVESTFELNVGDRAVVAINGTYMLPGMMVTSYKLKDGHMSGGRLCTLGDLQIKLEGYQDEPALVDYEVEVGTDFFVTKEKKDA